VVAEAKSAELCLKYLINKFGIPLVSAWNVQMAIVQATLLHGAEQWWDGKVATTKQFQLAINRLARGTLGCFSSTRLGPLLVEAGMIPAIPLLNYRHARYAQRFLGMLVDAGTMAPKPCSEYMARPSP
jgi:hypothetical protein